MTKTMSRHLLQNSRLRETVNMTVEIIKHQLNVTHHSLKLNLYTFHEEYYRKGVPCIDKSLKLFFSCRKSTVV